MSERSQGEHPDRDDVGILLRLAGKRAPVPAERSERVREAAREAWRHDVSRRARRRWTWTAAALAAAALGIALLAQRRSSDTTAPGPSSLTAATARVESIVGDVRVLNGESAAVPVRLSRGDEVRSGGELEVLGNGGVALRFPSGHAIRVGASTRVRLAGERELVLRRGLLYVDSGAGGGTDPAMSVRTPFGNVEEIGTRFEVYVADAAMRVRLREGRVAVRTSGWNRELAVRTELTVDAEGGAGQRIIAAFGPEWDWLLAVTPVPSFDGKSASALLAWVSRERGWTLAYHDAATRRLAETSVLRGAFDHLRIDEALAAGTLASRLTYRVDAGVLVVAALPPE